MSDAKRDEAIGLAIESTTAILGAGGKLDANAAAFRRALAEQGYAVGQDWQPIETAPKERGQVWHADWLDGTDVADFDKTMNEWYTPHDGSTFEPQPTHWRPLPAPPSAAEG